MLEVKKFNMLHDACNILVITSLKNVAILCGICGITESIMEIARAFKTNYNIINVVSFLNCNDSQSKNWVFMKKASEILKGKSF